MLIEKEEGTTVLKRENKQKEGTERKEEEARNPGTFIGVATRGNVFFSFMQMQRGENA